MKPSNAHAGRPYSGAVTGIGDLALRIATAFLITFAAAMVLIRAGAWGGALVGEAAIRPLFF